MLWIRWLRQKDKNMPDIIGVDKALENIDSIKDDKLTVILGNFDKQQGKDGGSAVGRSGASCGPMEN